MIFDKNLLNMISNNSVFFGFLFFIFGSMIGSFLNVVVLRYSKMMDSENAENVSSWLSEKNIAIPEEISKFITKFNLSYPSSHCYACGNALKWYHNIPILSYLFLRGKCGFCKTHISMQYPIVEFIGGSLVWLSYFKFINLGLEYVLLSGFILLTLLVLFLIDLKYFILPDTLNYILIWSSLILGLYGVNLLNLNIKQIILGSFFGYMSFYTIAFIGKLIKGEDVMGNGDFKLLAAIGSIMGLKGVVFTIFISPFFGIFTWFILKVFKNGERMIPFGPSLILASLYYLILGEKYIPEYLLDFIALIN
jgi:leader peptidase (prepilin peptidase)/N-methyltransferase